MSAFANVKTCDTCGRAEGGTRTVSVKIDGLLRLTAELCPQHADQVSEAVIRTMREQEIQRGHGSRFTPQR